MVGGATIVPYLPLYRTSTQPNFYTGKSVEGVRKSALRKVAKIRFGRYAAVKVRLEQMSDD